MAEYPLFYLTGQMAIQFQGSEGGTGNVGMGRIAGFQDNDNLPEADQRLLWPDTISRISNPGAGQPLSLPGKLERNAGI